MSYKSKLKYIVIKYDWLEKLDEDQLYQLNSILKTIDNNNSYYVCNTDEPYASKVLEVILQGEADKEDFSGIDIDILKNELQKIKNKQISIEGILDQLNRK